MTFVTHVITALSYVPETVWAAISASLLTLGGVLLSNRSQHRRFLRQLDHEARQRDREREMTLRTDVYLRAAEATAILQSIPGSLADLNTNIGEINRRLSETYTAIHRVYLTGDDRTLQAMMTYFNEFMDAHTRLAARRLALVGQPEAIARLQRQVDESAAERSQGVSLMREWNLRRDTDQHGWAQLQGAIDDEKQRSEAWRQEADALLRQQHAAELEFMQECHAEGVRVGHHLIPPLRAVRGELELPFDAAEFERLSKVFDRRGADLLQEVLKGLRAHEAAEVPSHAKRLGAESPVRCARTLRVGR